MKISLTLLGLLVGIQCIGQLTAVNFVDLDSLTYDTLTNILSKPAADSWSFGDGYSSNYLEPDSTGNIDYFIETPTIAKVFGASPVIQHGGGIAQVMYGFYINNSSLYIVNSGTIVGQFGRAVAGNQLTINFDGSSVNFKLKNNIIHTMTYDHTKTYLVNAVIYHMNGAFTNITTDLKQSAAAVPTPHYIELSDAPDNMYEVGEEGQVHFKFRYRLNYDSDIVEYKLFDDSHFDVSGSTSLLDNDLRYGTSIYSLDVSNISTGYYILEVSDVENEKLYARIKID